MDLYWFVIFYSVILWLFGYLAGRIHEKRLSKKELLDLVSKEIKKEGSEQNVRK